MLFAFRARIVVENYFVSLCVTVSSRPTSATKGAASNTPATTASGALSGTTTVSAIVRERMVDDIDWATKFLGGVR